MAVIKDKDRNTWYVKLWIKNPITGERTQKKKRGFKTKAEAKLAEAEMMKASGTVTSQTFKDMSDEYSIYMQHSEETKQKRIAHFTNRFADLYEMELKKITTPMLVKWQADLASTDYATRTKNDTITMVRSVFRYANEVYGLPNPSTILKRFKLTPEEKMHEMQVWTVDEFNQFIKCVESPYHQAFFRFLFWTGCRRGEAIALQKKDFKGNEVSITKSMKHFKNGFKPTKTGQMRKIRVDSSTMKKIKPCFDQPGGFVFGGEYPLSISSIQREFTAGIKASGVKKIRTHDLRHSHASILINSGVNIVAVSKRLGHSTVEMTLRVYTHLLEETDNDMMAKLEKLTKK